MNEPSAQELAELLPERPAVITAANRMLNMDIPPNDTQSEKCALGAGATTPEALATLLEMTSRDDFYFDVHRIIFDAFAAMHAAGTPVDALTLSEELNRQGTFDDVGGVPYITSILDAVPHAAHIKHYCRTVVDRSRRRKTIRKLEQGLWRIRPEDLETFELSRRTTNSTAPAARRARPTKRPATAKQWV